MARSITSLVLLALLALAGGWAGAAMYGLASIYADPTGSVTDMFGPFGVVVLIAVVVLMTLALAASYTAPERLRRIVRASSAAVVVLSLVGIAVGGQIGLEAKRAETAEPPGCGIGNPRLDREFAAIDHPGYFGGGSGSHSHCAVMLTADSLDVALRTYEEGLRGEGWEVAVEERSLVARRGAYRFTARLRTPHAGDRYLTVALHQRP